MMQMLPGLNSPLSHGAHTGSTARALLNILEDFSVEKDRLSDLQRAVLNILDDFTSEKSRLESTQNAVLNILDDSLIERERLQSMQKAILNILDDFELEKTRAEKINVELRREIIDRIAAERALNENSLALARSNSELEQFAYVASHDLQEPLRMVSSYVQLLADKYHDRLEPQAEKYIQYAVDGSQRMHGLISGLLEFSRIGRDEVAGRIQLRRAVDQAVANLQTSIRESNAVVTIDLLPEALGDPVDLQKSDRAISWQNLV